MKFIIIGYRDSYFWNQFGTCVRDLQIAEILSRNHTVIFINRPVSIYERILNKKKENRSYKPYNDRIRFIDTTSWNIFSPLKGRLWTTTCYQKLVLNTLSEESKDYDNKIVVLDFTPMADLFFVKKFNVVYWYDLIDNFKIHNRFSNKDKKIVSAKYKKINTFADIITGVSDKALVSFDNKNKYTVPNGVYSESAQTNEPINRNIYNSEYDIGFIGFITDKFDIAFVNALSQKYRIILWGKFFDNSIKNKFNKNIKLGGEFKYAELSKIVKTFKIGILPYLAEKSHDESPLKMYEYLKYSIPCLSSMDFEINNNPWIINYNSLTEMELSKIIDSFIINSGSPNIKETINKDFEFESKINEIINKLNKSINNDWKNS